MSRCCASVRVRARFEFLLVCVFTLTLVTAKSQDIHFSQFGATPLNYNPALVGDFDGDFRVGAAERNQWRSVTKPFQTANLFFDAKRWIKPTGTNFGAYVYHDIEGDSKFSTLTINLALSQSIKLNKDSTWFLALGAMGGISQRTIDYEALRFDNQYNGYLYDPNLANGETFQNEGRLFENVIAGVQISRRWSRRRYFNAGLSGYNLTDPAQTFYSDNDILLDKRFNLHSVYGFEFSDKWDAIPELLISRQGTYTEAIIGAAFRYIKDEDEDHFRAFRAGAWFRSRDAGFVNLGADIGQWYAGVSYDINVSTLTPASNYRGGIEIVVIYIWKKFPERIHHKLCPDYI